jgi:NADH-quinone oxidoreductase subunit G
VVSLELRSSPVTELADVVLPVASTAEKSGGFMNWEGRYRGFGKVLRDSHALPDLRVLAGIADEMGVDLGFRTTEQVQAELGQVGAWDGDPAPFPTELSGAQSARTDSPSDKSVAGGLRLATWKLMLGDGRMQDGDEYLRATARGPVALVSPTTMSRLGLAAGRPVTLTGARGSLTVPVAVADLPDDVVWTATTSAWSAGAGDLVRVTPADGAGS